VPESWAKKVRMDLLARPDRDDVAGCDLLHGDIGLQAVADDAGGACLEASIPPRGSGGCQRFDLLCFRTLQELGARQPREQK